MEYNQKYIILDFGKVLGKPKTGEWFITPNFNEVLDNKKVDKKQLKVLFYKYNYIISQKIVTKEEEYNVFKDFYFCILKDLKIKGDLIELASRVAENFVYNKEKYIMYNDVYRYLERMSKEHILILLSDNWPCVYDILKYWKIYEFFDKIFISSEYQELKKDGKFFDYAINYYKIKPNEAIFIDDNIELLDVAKQKNLIPILMDRDNVYQDFNRYSRIVNFED